MKLYEIEGYLDGRKVRKKEWGNSDYIYFKKGFWVWDDGDVFCVDEDGIKENWEEYKEPKKKEKYHLYNIKSSYGWWRTQYFFNDKGLTSGGFDKYGTALNWNELKKQDNLQKLENEYIEV